MYYFSLFCLLFTFLSPGWISSMHTLTSHNTLLLNDMLFYFMSKIYDVRNCLIADLIFLSNVVLRFDYFSTIDVYLLRSILLQNDARRDFKWDLD